MKARPLDGLVWRVYLDASAALAVNTPDQPVEWSRFHFDGIDALRIGSQQQPVLEKEGDNLRIDWGYFYLAAPADVHATETAGGLNASRASFLSNGSLRGPDDSETNRAANNR